MPSKAEARRTRERGRDSWPTTRNHKKAAQQATSEALAQEDLLMRVGGTAADGQFEETLTPTLSQAGRGGWIFGSSDAQVEGNPR